MSMCKHRWIPNQNWEIYICSFCRAVIGNRDHFEGFVSQCRNRGLPGGMVAQLHYVDNWPPEPDDPAEILRQMRREDRDPLNALEACILALRSYQYGNGSPELAKEVADYAEATLEAVKRESAEKLHEIVIAAAKEYRERGEGLPAHLQSALDWSEAQKAGQR